MRGSFTDSVCFSVPLAGIWRGCHSHCLCGVGRDLTPAPNARVNAWICACARGHVCGCTFVHLLYIFACVRGEWRAACPCLVWLGFIRPLGNRTLDSLTAWMGRREGEERKRRRRGGKKRGGGTVRGQAHLWAHTYIHQQQHAQRGYLHAP